MSFPIPCLAATASQVGRAGGELSDDTSLSEFRINGSATVDGGTLPFVFGTTDVTVVATPTHPGATVGSIMGSSGLVTGDNALMFNVTAEDGVTVQEYNVTLHVLTEGAKERTQVTITGGGGSWATGGAGNYIDIYNADGLHRFWVNTGSESEPSSEGGVLHEVSSSDLASQETIAAAFRTAMTASLFTSVSISGAEFIVEDLTVGVRTDASSYGAATITVTQQGEDPS